MSTPENPAEDEPSDSTQPASGEQHEFIEASPDEEVAAVGEPRVEDVPPVAGRADEPGAFTADGPAVDEPGSAPGSPSEEVASTDHDPSSGDAVRRIRARWLVVGVAAVAALVWALALTIV